MERAVGAVVGLTAFGASMATGLFSNAPVDRLLLRSGGALMGGMIVGWLVLAPLGAALVRAAAVKRGARISDDERRLP